MGIRLRRIEQEWVEFEYYIDEQNAEMRRICVLDLGGKISNKKFVNI